MQSATFGARLVAVPWAFGALVVLAPTASADFAGGKRPKSDCYVVYQGFEITKGKSKSECMDGDFTCDTDGACNDSCTFEVTACTNGTVARCTAANVTSVTFNPAGVIDSPPTPTSGSLCGNATPVRVDLTIKPNGKKKPGKAKIAATAVADAKPRKDKDLFTLFCTERVGECPKPACCALRNDLATPASWLGLTTDAGTGDCGFYFTTAGAATPLKCGGLYFGGGGNAVPLPVEIPDQGRAVSKIVSCDADTATVGPATSADTGSIRTCTDSGCFFGAPLAVPNSGTTPLSTCVVNQLASGVGGTVNCASGESQLSAPLSSIIYLTGDGKTDPGNSINGIQPCPLCSAGTCIGGPNNGMACTPGTTALTASYPTSHDCPPDESTSIGALPVAFALTSGSVTWRATPATNDSGSTASVQARVFSGFCRDVALPGATGSFDVDPAPGTQLKQCWENGMAVGPPCSETDNGCESCEQRTFGAFGPGGGGVATITAVGKAFGNLTFGSGIGTLASVFSIPATENAQVNNAGDLPGPGAVTLPGTARLCADAMACP